MKSILRATAMLSGSSLASILIGLVSAKAFSSLLGPSGVGFMGLLQALVGLVGLLAGMGIGAGLVRMAADALAQDDYQRVAALRRAVWLLLGGPGGLAVLLLFVFRIPISVWMLGGPEHAWSVVLMGFALLFNLASGLQTSILNAYHRVSVLARIGIVNSLLGTVVSLAFVWQWRERGITPAIIAGAMVGCSISTYYLAREPHQVLPRPSWVEVLRNAWALLRFGVPYTASMLVGTGVQFMLPSLVLHTLGTDGVGYHRAAISVSGVYLGFLLTAMAYDYYPRISAAGTKPAEMVRLVNQQHRLVMLLAVPMILGTLALTPYLIPLVYSPAFSPAVDILEWQLIGDLFKFSSWTVGFVILVRSGSSTLFIVELISGVNMLAISWLGMHAFGLAGLGIGFLATYIAHYFIVWMIARREIALVWTTANRLMLFAAVLAAGLVRGLSIVGLERWRLPVALTLALLAGLGSLYVIWKEIGGQQRFDAWRDTTGKRWLGKWRRRRGGGVPADDARLTELGEHYEVFQQLVVRTKGLADRGAHDAAAVYAEIAANYAMSHHPGIFASPQLEELLHTIGNQPSSRYGGRVRNTLADGMPGKVLHVLTRASSIGGDGRYVWRWIGRDVERVHSVVLTRQGAAPVPDMLREAVAATGGQIHVLNERRGGLRHWASILLTIADHADIVILHVHPYDVIPTLAFANRARRPPIVFVDHADHAFWLGIGISDVVASLRASGQRLAQERRGVSPARSALLPIPLPPLRRALSRAEAKAQLGLPEDAVILLSIARPHKYVSRDVGASLQQEVSFIDALIPILEQHPQAVALVVGPDPTGQWHAAAARVRGRIQALGMREDTAIFYQAADIYLDSYPIVSITSLLEAGSYGLPLVSRQPTAAESGVLGADTPGLTHLVCTGDVAEYRAAIGRLIENAPHREQLGEETRCAIEAVHAGAPWQHALHALYRQALAIEPVSWTMPVSADRQVSSELDLLLPELFSGEPDLEAIISFHLRLMPPHLRLPRWLASLRTRKSPSPGLLLPEWLGTRLEQWRTGERSVHSMRGTP